MYNKCQSGETLGIYFLFFKHSQDLSVPDRISQGI